MTTSFRSRKEQIEKDFLRKLKRDLRAVDCPLNRKGTKLVKEELRAAAMIGAAEERYRTLALLKQHRHVTGTEICEQGVLAVLGYED